MQTSSKSADKYWLSSHLLEGSNKLLDPLSSNIVRMRRAITSFTIYTYRGEPLTSLVYDVYGNTSLWWIVLYFNGYILPTEIPYGTVLKFPDRDQLSNYLGKNASVFGTKVTL